MDSQSHRSFRPEIATPVRVEGLEARRLLSGGGKVLVTEVLRAHDLVQAEAAPSTRGSKLTVGEDQPVIGRAAEGNSIVQSDAVETSPSSSDAYEAVASSDSASNLSGDNSLSDSAPDGSSASTGDTGSGIEASQAASFASPVLAANQSLARSKASTGARRALDDEASDSSSETTAPEDTQSVASSAAIFSTGEAQGEIATTSASSGTTSVFVSGSATAGPPVLSEDGATSPAQSPSSATSPSDAQNVATLEAGIATTARYSVRAHRSHEARLNAGPTLPEPELSLDEMPGPFTGDLAGDFLPFDRALLERAVDRFIDDFDRVAAELVHLGTSPSVLTTISVVAISALACGVIMEQRRRSRRGGDNPAPSHEDGFSYITGLPHSWSWSLART